MEFIDYYEVLQVHPCAHAEVIEKAYKALIFKYHPDRGGDEERTKLITAAYYVLSNAQRRSEYDEACRNRARRPAQEVPPTRASGQVLLPDDIPTDVLDAIIAQHLLCAVAATARHAGQAVGSAAAEGAKAVGHTVVERARAHSDAQYDRDRARRREIAEARRPLVERELRKLSRGWRMPISAAAWEMAIGYILDPDGTPVVRLNPEDYLWLQFRHPSQRMHNYLKHAVADLGDVFVAGYCTRCGRGVVISAPANSCGQRGHRSKDVSHGWIIDYGSERPIHQVQLREAEYEKRRQNARPLHLMRSALVPLVAFVGLLIWLLLASSQQ